MTDNSSAAPPTRLPHAPLKGHTDQLPRTADVVVIGAGVIGAACAFFSARAGLKVGVVDLGEPASGTSSGGEGNLLVSDKEPGPELQLALYSMQTMHTELADQAALWEFEAKGGLMVASTPDGAEALTSLSHRQRANQVHAENLRPADLREVEPNLSTTVVAGVFYPQDAQVQPMLMTAQLLRLACDFGATVIPHTMVTGFLRSGDRVTGVLTNRGPISANACVNAAGTGAGRVAGLAGVRVPVEPRRGFILVTEPQPGLVRHKVYGSDYLANVASSVETVATSPVIEGTPSGPILIGSSRERVGFDRRMSVPVIARLAQAAIDLFPVLTGAKVWRSYLGFRPYCEDHLPVIGPDPRAPGLWHAAGHEGSGIGMAAGTGRLIAQSLIGLRTGIDVAAFSPDRFTKGVIR